MSNTIKRNRRTVREQQLTRNRDAFRRVISSAGSQQQVARELGVTQAAVSKWLVRGWAPVPRAREMEALFGVSRMELIKPELADALTPVEMHAVDSVE